jgi:hypothetical protein
MSVWLREVVGWVLLGTGVAAFGLTYFVFLLNRRLLEAGPMAFIGFVVFRGGLHLIKVASAAKALRDAAAGDRPAPARRPAVGYGATARPGEPRRSVVPGANGSAPRR